MRRFDDQARFHWSLTVDEDANVGDADDAAMIQR
jgi:hypothetical protein